MALTDKLTAVADVIRAKNGSSGTLTLPQMASTAEQLATPAPAYHYDNAYSVTAAIKALQNANTITFGVITDSHVSDINSGGSGSTYESQTKTSIRRAAFALETVGKAVGLDFVANLGDNVWENRLDSAAAVNSMKYLNHSIAAAFSSFTSFRLVGNHDQSDSDTFGNVYSYIGAYNSFDVAGTTAQRGYGYKDFDSKKLRVICLNTSDYYNVGGGYGMSYEQKQFLMSALDLSGKSTPSQWKIILLSHIPLDYPGGDYNTVSDVQAVLNAYVNGSTVSLTVNSSYASAEHESASGTISYNYSGKNSAKIIGNFHGHIHNHCYGRMADNDIVRICAPNTCFKNEKSTADYGGGMYDYPTAYPKTLETANETAVTFFVIDTAEEKINAVVYGAGVNRTVSYGEETPVQPFDYTVADLAIGSRSNWEVDASGTTSTGIELANVNTNIAVGVSTQNALGFTDRDSNPLYVMPVPAQATKVSVTCTDSALVEIFFKGVKFSGSNYTRVFNTGWQSTFTHSFDLGSIDYITIALRRTDGTSVSWNYPEANVTVQFSNH